VSAGLPVVSGAEAIRVFERLGYVAVRQRGSHVRLRHAQNARL
jgi:predicted RNA binding protein YcfA (HicA-like mRNA interferase family)